MNTEKQAKQRDSEKKEEWKLFQVENNGKRTDKERKTILETDKVLAKELFADQAPLKTGWFKYTADM